MFRKIPPPILISLLLILVTACGNPANIVKLTSADQDGQVEVKSGGEVVINLDGNPSTGYTWEAKDLDATLFEQVGDATFVSSNPGLVGSGGTLSLTFKALKKGNATLTLVYHRPWEIGIDPIDTFEVMVTVK